LRQRGETATRAGATVFEAAVQGARARFRPILMTSFAFIAGLIPLVIATGPGAVGNRTIGASALGGSFEWALCGFMPVSKNPQAAPARLGTVPRTRRDCQAVEDRIFVQ